MDSKENNFGTIFSALVAWRKAKSDSFAVTCELLALGLPRNLEDIRVTPNSSLSEIRVLAYEFAG